MGTIIITPPVFLELFIICLNWEWEQAVERFEKSLGSERLVWPTVTGFTTVDKVARVLHGLDILTARQRESLHKDRRTQYLFFRKSHVVGSGGNIRKTQDAAREPLVLQCDVARDIDRVKMLRNMRFYISKVGMSEAEILCVDYSGTLTKERYFTEIVRQEKSMPKSNAGRGAIMKRYLDKVNEEDD